MKRALRYAGLVVALATLLTAASAQSFSSDHFLILRIDSVLDRGHWLTSTLPDSPNQKAEQFELTGNKDLVLTPGQIVHARGSLDGFKTSKQTLRAREVDTNVPQSYATNVDGTPVPGVVEPKGDKQYGVMMVVTILERKDRVHYTARELTSGEDVLVHFKHSDGTVEAKPGSVLQVWGDYSGPTSDGRRLFVAERDRDLSQVNND